MNSVRLRFDFPGADGLEFARPSTVHVARGLGEVSDVLAASEAAARGGSWVAGYVAYEAAPAFDPVLQTHPLAGPAAWFAVFDAPVGTLGPAGAPRPSDRPRDQCGALRHGVRTQSPEPDEGATKPGDWTSEPCSERVRADLARISEEIARGVTYQVNYTIRRTAPAPRAALGWYTELLAAHRPPYAAFLDTGERKLVSLSPELFFDLDGDLVSTCPMKGTAARGRFPTEDERARARLASSPKERAENVMIADLLRNDLSRIARPGTVATSGLCAVETYPTFHALTSTVSARLTPGAGLVEIFEALFPCGSVTGAPKSSTMRLITELEDAPRGVYCGAIGLLRPGGDATFSVPIRTIEIVDGQARFGVGGGIVWDSDPDAELAELAVKSAFLTAARPVFDLLETMLSDGTDITDLAEHLDRAEASAHYFGRAFPRERIRDAICAAIAGVSGPHIVRLLVDAAGHPRVEVRPGSTSGSCAPHDQPAARSGPGAGEKPPSGSALCAGPDRAGAAQVTAALTIRIAGEPVDSADVFLFHKTTHRTVYDRARARHPGCDDVLLVNERGEVTEFTIGNLVAELDGSLVTPPQECGLLAGTLRARELASGRLTARVLSVADVRRASRLWRINSVRGWERAELSEPDSAAQ